MDEHSLQLKADGERLRSLHDSIVKDICELHRLENAERRVANRGKSILYTFSKTDLEPEHYGKKSALRGKVFEEQRAYLDLQAEIERRISTVPDHAARLMLSWHFADLLTYKQAAEHLGGMTDSGAQMILGRYFAQGRRGRDSP